MPKEKKLYQLYAPNGVRIKGTYDVVQGAALIQGVFKKGKKFVPEWAGETEMFWDTQETQTKDGEQLYLDEDGDEWKESELVLKPE